MQLLLKDADNDGNPIRRTSADAEKKGWQWMEWYRALPYTLWRWEDAETSRLFILHVKRDCAVKVNSDNCFKYIHDMRRVQIFWDCQNHIGRHAKSYMEYTGEVVMCPSRDNRRRTVSTFNVQNKTTANHIQKIHRIQLYTENITQHVKETW